MKSNAKAYRLMSIILCLPSAKTLRNLLNSVLLSPGINSHMFKNLEACVEKLSQNDRLFAIVFDEVSIATPISYSKVKTFLWL